MDTKLKELLKQEGLRLTQARSHLYNLLSHSSKALNPKEIFEALKKISSDIDLVSIYRNLSTFEKLNIVHKLQDGRYQICTIEHEHHDHIHVLFHCLKCGLTEELSHDSKGFCKAVKKIQEQSELAHSFDQFTLSGICVKCV